MRQKPLIVSNVRTTRKLVVITEDQLFETLLVLELPIAKAREAAHVIYRQVLVAEIREHATEHNKKDWK